MAEAPFANPKDLLSGEGAAKFGQRWNPPGLRAVYACLDASLAMLEWQTQRKKAGLRLRRHLPLTQVTILTSLRNVLDFQDPATARDFGLALEPFVLEKHRSQVDGDPELLAQAFGRIADRLKLEAVIVPAAPDPSRFNLVVYVANLHRSSTLRIHGERFLASSRIK